MPGLEKAPDEALDIGRHWVELVGGYATRNRLHAVTEDSSVMLEFPVPTAERTVTMRFMTVRRLLVAFIADGRNLKPDQLALAAAAANAWNTEQLIPMLSVWDVRGPTPCLGGICVLPLACRLTVPAFDALVADWVERSGQMFTRCHQVFEL